MNGQRVEVSPEEFRDFITHVLTPNAYWRHSGLLTEDEVMKFLKGESNVAELKELACYILIYTECLSFTAYLFDKADGKPERCREFNMPAVQKLRDIYRRLTENQRTLEELAGDVHEMENICMETGAEPL